MVGSVKLGRLPSSVLYRCRLRPTADHGERVVRREQTGDVDEPGGSHLGGLAEPSSAGLLRLRQLTPLSDFTLKDSLDSVDECCRSLRERCRGEPGCLAAEGAERRLGVAVELRRLFVARTRIRRPLPRTTRTGHRSGGFGTGAGSPRRGCSLGLRGVLDRFNGADESLRPSVLVGELADSAQIAEAQRTQLLSA